MTAFVEEFVDVARSHIGEPFQHHFKPVDKCKGGSITMADCMERGMDSSGYDCSGFVIASLCEVIGIKPTEWSRDYRHVKQFETLAADTQPEFGDFLLFDSIYNDGRRHRTHLGIFTARRTIVHASAHSNLVEEGSFKGVIVGVRTIPNCAVTELTNNS